MRTHGPPHREYRLEYFRSYQGFLLESNLSAEGAANNLSEAMYSGMQPNRDTAAIELLRKVEQRHGIPFDVRLVVDDIGPRPNYHGKGLDHSGWLQIQRWMKLDDDQTMELKLRYKGDWHLASENYLRTLQGSPEAASRIYERLLPDAERYRFKTALTDFMTGAGRYRWRGAGLLLVRKQGVVVYLPQKDQFYLDFLGELLFQGRFLLDSAVEGRIKKALQQVDWHNRILDKLEEAATFVAIERKLRYANCEIDALGVGQPYAEVEPDSVFVLEATPALNYDALGQVEWYQHVITIHQGNQPYKGIVCERIPNEEFLEFCCQRGIAVFLVGYTGVDVYRPKQTR